MFLQKLLRGLSQNRISVYCEITVSEIKNDSGPSCHFKKKEKVVETTFGLHEKIPFGNAPGIGSAYPGSSEK